MTHDSVALARRDTFTDTFLWLTGVPTLILLTLYLLYLAPSPDLVYPETFIPSLLAGGLALLLTWNLLCSLLAHLACARLTPRSVRAACRFVVSHIGTRLSRTIVMRAGSSALIGSALLAGPGILPALASPEAPPPSALALTWADTPLHNSMDLPSTSEDAPTVTGAAHIPAVPTPLGEDSATTPPDSVDTSLSATHVVRAGESLWSIASQRLPGADNEEIARAVVALVEANQSRIDDPSLIYPGQVLTVPQELS